MTSGYLSDALRQRVRAAAGEGAEHFQWDAEGVVILGLTPVGRATIEAVRLNHEHSIAVRRNWVAAGWHPPSE
ncbi:MAG: hypothetical protein HY260_17065 [Chloroflexi bacterium]|nr:hypothetical protein [Chloroflexota bacterium]